MRAKCLPLQVGRTRLALRVPRAAKIYVTGRPGGIRLESPEYADPKDIYSELMLKSSEPHEDAKIAGILGEKGVGTHDGGCYMFAAAAYRVLDGSVIAALQTHAPGGCKDSNWRTEHWLALFPDRTDNPEVFDGHGLQRLRSFFSYWDSYFDRLFLRVSTQEVPKPSADLLTDPVTIRRLKPAIKAWVKKHHPTMV